MAMSHENGLKARRRASTDVEHLTSSPCPTHGSQQEAASHTAAPAATSVPQPHQLIGPQVHPCRPEI